MIDFSPVENGEMKMLAYTQSAGITWQQVRDALNESVDTLHVLLDGLEDVDVTFVPYDPHANDPFAPPEEQHIGWNIAHLILHVTASTEEYAAIGSVLGRGIAFEGRLRYEPDWKTVTTVAALRQRLEESRRIRLAYLDALPDQPFMDVYRVISERYIEYFGQSNCMVSFLIGLMHEVGHYEQIRDARRQALAARQQG